MKIKNPTKIPPATYYPNASTTLKSPNVNTFSYPKKKFLSLTIAVKYLIPADLVLLVTDQSLA
jgi:hypothetical protein